jgi:hypothetical protein
MYSLTIHFGPNAITWALLFKEESNAGKIYNAFVDYKINNAKNGVLIGSDDFGQAFAIPFDEIRGIMLEDLDLTNEAKIIRSLDNARSEIKARQRAATDPTIRTGMQQQGTSVLTPFPRN